MKELRELQLLQLEILKKVDRICRENGINYFLYGGTLLGAVRHKGFIPWDDDLDIAMHRDDYDKFEMIIGRELGEKYFFQSYKTDEYPHFIAKVRVNGTTFIEPLTRHMKIHQGVFIDILILDNVPDTEINRKWFQVVLKFLYSIISTKAVYFDYKRFVLWKKIVGRVMKFLFAFIPLKPLIYIYNRFQKKYSRIQTKYVGQTSKAKPHRRCYKKDSIYPVTEIEFENGYFLAPKNYEEMLTVDFGDYMELPPESERCAKHSFIVDINTDYTHYYLNDQARK